MVGVPNSDRTAVLSVVRQNERDKVFAAFCFSCGPATATFRDSLYEGHYPDVFSDEDVDLGPGLALDLAPWSYRVSVR